MRAQSLNVSSISAQNMVMPSDRVELSFSIEKMTFSFKGDRETGQGVQRSIERSLNNIV